MVKSDSFDNRYRYYFYGSNSNDDIFRNGLMIDDENLFQFSETSNVLLYGLEKYIKKYADVYKFDYVWVIKIPVYYLGWIHRDGTVEPFVPFLMDINDEGKKKIISNLIYTVYNNSSQQCIYNEQYNPLYNPVGLHYSDKQLATMYRFGEFDWYSSGVNRNSYAYGELKKIDEEKRVFERIINHYSSGNIIRALRRIKRKIF